MSVASVAQKASGVSRPQSPYVGLVPYDESDAAFFFGRSTEIAIVKANLHASRLTILYGPSGVGKSSLLMAGAVHGLRDEATTAVTERPFAVCALRSWLEDPALLLREAARAALQELAGAEPLPPPAGALIDTLRVWTAAAGTLLVVLDQFEEYFQYHPDESGEERLTGFADDLAQIVNDPALPVNVLLSIREDAWAKLDRFEGHVPAVFTNYVRVDNLDKTAAREAIEGPIEAWNRTLPEGDQPYTVEPPLVAAVLAATATGHLALTADNESPAIAAPSDTIEAPFLQLVLDRLWRDAVSNGQHTLTLARLDELGGAAAIVENHLRDALALLSADQQDTAADCFRFLVRGTGKIAQATSDLAEWTQRPNQQITDVLDALCAGEGGRILRAIAPAESGGSTSYELFHDILAQPILAWRKEHEQQRAQEAEAARQRAARRRLLIGGSVALALAVVFAALATVALIEKQHTDALNRTINHSNLLLQQRIDSLLRTKAANALTLSSRQAKLTSLSNTNHRLTAETDGLKKTRNALDLTIRTLRATNRELAADVVQLNAANAKLAKKIDSLNVGYQNLGLAGLDALNSHQGLQENSGTLSAETRTLNATLAGLQGEQGRLSQKLLAAGFIPPRQHSHSGAKFTDGVPPPSRTSAAQYLVPGDVAGSDTLRRKVAALEAELQAQLVKKARLADEVKWFTETNLILDEQRRALIAEVAQLGATKSRLEVRQGALQQAEAGASSENRKLSLLAGTLEARNAKKRKQVVAQQNANANLQSANSDAIVGMASLQAEIVSARTYNQVLVAELMPPLGKVLQGARSGDPEVAALLAVDASLIAPYDPDDPAHPSVLNAMWLALNRLDASAAQRLTAAPRSALLERTLCGLAKTPLTAAQRNRLLGFLPPRSTSKLQHPCG